MANRAERPSEIGRDALDLAGPAPIWSRLFPARHAALGLKATPAPALGFIALGVLLGPAAVRLLPNQTVLALDPAVSVALAALGMFVGLGVGAPSSRGQGSLWLAAWLEASVTAVVVGGATYILLRQWQLPLPASPALFSAVLGICASASAATRSSDSGSDAARVGRLVDLDDVPLIAFGAVLVAVAGSGNAGTSLVTGGTAALLVAIGGSLLFDRARSPAERGVYVAGSVVLLGGVGAYASVSPLLTGALAGLVWSRGPGRADQVIARDLQALQHPLVALLLIVAGASIQWTVALLWIAGPLVALRLMGKLLAGLAAARLTGLPAGMLTVVSVPSGVLGVALALNVQQVLGSGGTLLLSAVTVAAGISELLSALLTSDEGMAE
jgi:hypothetical protein